MTNSFRTYIDLQDIIKICNNWFYSNITNQKLNDIIKDINNLDWVVGEVLPEEQQGDSRVSSNIPILIDDILEMDSLSSAEKEQEIRQLVEDNKDGLQNLARQVIAKLEADFEQTKIDLKEQVKEMEEKGYEQDTIDKFIKKILGTEGFEDNEDK